MAINATSNFTPQGGAFNNIVGGAEVNINDNSAQKAADRPDEDVSPDGAADYLLTYDDSASVNKRVLLDNLPGASGDVSAGASITADRVVIGDDDAKGVKESVVTIASGTGNTSGMGTLGCGAITSSSTVAGTGFLGASLNHTDNVAVLITNAATKSLSITNAGDGEGDFSVTQGDITLVDGDIILTAAGSTVDGRDLTVDGAKLDGIEAAADVTDATNVNAAGATMNTDATMAGNSYFLDEDAMGSDSATQVASQQSIKAYVDALTHDGFADFVADEHVAHGGVTLTAGDGLNGGGTIAANRTFAVDTALRTRCGNFYVENPAAADSFPGLLMTHAVTFVEVNGTTDTGTVTFNLERRGRTTPDQVGTDILSSDLAADATSENTTSFAASGAVAADQKINLNITSVASSPTKVWIDYEYTVDA